MTADSDEDPEAAAREAELSWELPNGGARVVRPAEQAAVQPKPKLQRQDHPGPSRVLSEFRRQRRDDDDVAPEVGDVSARPASSVAADPGPRDAEPQAEAHEEVATPHADVAAKREARSDDGARREPRSARGWSQG